MKLHEIFDSKIKFRWRGESSYELTEFSVNEVPYALQIETRKIPGASELKDGTAEISFFRADSKNIDLSYSTSTDHQSAVTALYGIMLNALIQKSSEYKAFYFSAEERHSSDLGQFEQKINLYDVLASRFSRKVGWTKYSHRSQFTLAHEILVTDSELDKNNKYWLNPMLEVLNKHRK